MVNSGVAPDADSWRKGIIAGHLPAYPYHLPGEIDQSEVCIYNIRDTSNQSSFKVLKHRYEGVVMEKSKQPIKTDKATVTWDNSSYELTITASGEVNTGGWTDPEIQLNAESPESGILQFELVAQPPGGDYVTQVFTPIGASKTFKVEVRGANFR